MRERTGTDKKQLYCCSSYYQVFIALLKALTQKQAADLVLEEHGIETAGELAKRLEAGMKGCIEQVFVCPDSKEIDPYCQRCASFFPWQKRKVLRHVEAVSPHLTSAHLRAYENIHVFWDLGYIGTYLNICRIPYILHEDSLNSYQHIRANRPNYAYIFQKNGWKFKLKKRFHLGVIPFGYSENCIAVEVNAMAGIEIPTDKVREVPRREMEAQLTREQKEELFALFAAGKVLGNKKNAGKVLLLLTEPFAVTKRLPGEEAQVKLYRDLLADYAEDGQVLIKPHPRDGMDYRKYFPEAEILEKNIPMEILNFHEDFRVFRALTVSSSAIWGLTCAQEKIYLGQEFLSSYKINRTDMEN